MRCQHFTDKISPVQQTFWGIVVEDKAQKWLFDKVAYIKGLKSPTDTQSLLVLLAEKADRTEQDEKKLRLLINAEKASERAQRARLQASKVMVSEKLAERKARNHRLIKQGILFDLAGLATRTPEERLGMLLLVAEAVGPEDWQHYQQAGAQYLLQRGLNITEFNEDL